MRALTLVTLIGLLLGSAAPVSAATAEGAYARFAKVGGAGGLAIVDYIDEDDIGLDALLVGLEPERNYRIVGRSVGCNGSPSAANRLFAFVAATDDSGTLNISVGIHATESTEWEALRSIWIDLGHPAAADGFPRCARASVFVAAGDVDGDGGLGLIATTYGRGIFLVERTGNARARVTLVLPGIIASDEYFVRGAGAPCGERPRTFERYLGIHIPRIGDEVVVAYMASRRVDLTQSELDDLQSLRIRNTSTAERWGCGPVQLIALLVP